VPSPPHGPSSTSQDRSPLFCFPALRLPFLIPSEVQVVPSSNCSRPPFFSPDGISSAHRYPQRKGWPRHIRDGVPPQGHVLFPRDEDPFPFFVLSLPPFFFQEVSTPFQGRASRASPPFFFTFAFPLYSVPSLGRDPRMQPPPPSEAFCSTPPLFSNGRRCNSFFPFSCHKITSAREIFFPFMMASLLPLPVLKLYDPPFSDLASFPQK